MDRFKKLQPLVFSKISSEAMQPKRWINSLEKAFDVLECTDVQKLICDGYQLQNEAEVWWKATRPNLEAVHPNFTWDQFKEVFSKNYFPESFKDRKEAEVSTLVQGSKLVLNYQQQFKDLFHFTPEHIKGEASKSKKFEKVLKSGIGSILSVLDIQDYAQMVNKAKIMEDRLKEKATVVKTRQKDKKFKKFRLANQGILRI
ncbi:uncharacterized protein LOC122638842 [Telopea speciosissima]|uniref:uncharacterized protein LOC122638842 n=1 Tax=Telopea speciosissima TaxID=54955 RepID=UPI001CC3E8A4|nr:uncharacterized protein LOC122638842 [Telopea speciosissima]